MPLAMDPGLQVPGMGTAGAQPPGGVSSVKMPAATIP
jgi:hypothetical protein